KCDDDERGQSGRSAEAAEGVARVIDEVGQPVDAAGVADLLLALIEAVHRAQRGEARLLRREPPGEAFLDLVFEMETKLLLHLALDLASAEDRLESQRQRVEQVLNLH